MEAATAAELGPTFGAVGAETGLAVTGAGAAPGGRLDHRHRLNADSNTENRGPSSADASSTSLGLNNIPIPVGRGPEDPGVVRPTEKRTRTLRSS